MTLPIFLSLLFVICVNIAGSEKNVFTREAAKKKRGEEKKTTQDMKERAEQNSQKKRIS